MRFLTRVFLFIIIFSLLFLIIRTYDIIHVATLSKELGGIGWLYSIIGLIFGVISGFVIQTQWNDWDKLVSAMHGELKSLRQLYQYTAHISPQTKKRIRTTIKAYLHAVIEDWHSNLNGSSTNEINLAMQNLQEDIILLENQPRKFETAMRFFLTFVGHHEDVIHYTSRRLPKLLHILIVFSSSLVIVLSLFIGVRTLWLDYVITLAIALLSFLIYYVIHDLENPLREGNWHLTSVDYQTFLKELKKEK